MSLRSASPEAETMSHCPPPPSFMRLTISSDEPAGCWLILHLVAASNGFTQPEAAQPAHRTSVSWPSPSPIEVSGFISAVGGLACWLPVLLPLLEPHAVISTSTAIVAAPRLMPSLPPLVEHVCVIRSPGQPNGPALQ